MQPKRLYLCLGVSVFFSALIRIPIVIVLYLTARKRILANGIVNNILRSIPFIILHIVMMPLTVFLVGSSLGAIGFIPPLVFGAFPFFARLVENFLQELDDGVINMAKSCGVNNMAYFVTRNITGNCR